MIVLTLFLCAIGPHRSCYEQVIPAQFDSAMECIIHGQQVAAEWMGDHPGYRLDGWRCGRDERKT